MTTADLQKTSTALKANLEETRREVVIPPEFAGLLSEVRDYYGVHQTTEKLLMEYFHPMRNLIEVATILGKICQTMFTYFEQGPQRAISAKLFAELFRKLYLSELNPESLGKVFRPHIQFFQVLNQSAHRPEYEDTIAGMLDDFCDVLEKQATVLIKYSNLLKSVGRKLNPEPATTGRYMELYRTFLINTLKTMMKRLHILEWFRKWWPEQEHGWAEALTGHLAKYLSDAIHNLESCRDNRQILQQLNVDDVLNYTLRYIDDFDNPAHRIDCYIFLAGVEEIHFRTMEVLRGLNRSIRDLCAVGKQEEILHTIDILTGYLDKCTAAQKLSIFKGLERLGKELAHKGHRASREYFIESLVAKTFESPNIAGVSDDWQVMVNPHHLAFVRTWLAIIEADSDKYEHLLSALVVNLHFRGIFISDTDLFQKDITVLLNSRISPVFNLVLQLVSFFPVFFNEIGSEGDLREVSTRIDQISHRKDEVVHFLRKQCHAESNNRLIGFADSVLRYWLKGEREHLKPHLPKSLYATLPQEDSRWYRSAKAVVRHLHNQARLDIEDLERLPFEEIKGHLDDIPDIQEQEKERVYLLIKLHRLLMAKYAYSHDELLPLLVRSPLIGKNTRLRFQEACHSKDAWVILRAGNKVLQELKDNINDPAITEGYEDIYYKRHIAAGIPSMYGTYQESKFDSMGLMIRVMAFLKLQLEQVVSNFNYNYMTRGSILEAYQLMQEMLQGFKIAGLRVEDLSQGVALLKRSFSVGNFTASQYLNVIEFIAQALNRVVEANYIAVHNDNLKVITRQLLKEKENVRNASDDQMEAQSAQMSEIFLRTFISQTFAIQEFDRFLTKIKQTLTEMTGTLDERDCAHILNYSPAKLISFINDPIAKHEDQLSLGYKGYALKKLKALKLPIPEGFIISTEFFNIRSGMEYHDLRWDTRMRIFEALERLEKMTGRKLGDPDRPLLLSVRSGGAVSMPGMLDTIINVGLNDKIVEAAAKEPNRAWSTWDCYRRFIQSYSMSQGIDRNVFDDIMLEHKDIFKVEKKLEFTPAQMRELAHEYKNSASSKGIKIFQDPHDQMMRAIYLVLRSWNSERARMYRRQMQLSDDWGTGVIVQKMVLGNLNHDSGTGALFTKDPRASATGIGLFGDFTMGSQGEDVVAGLVHPYPISEEQRETYSAELSLSLESQFPDIYQRLSELATFLIYQKSYEHQEIEFTFESTSPDDLYILQTRPMSSSQGGNRPVFAKPELMNRHHLGTGIGVSGGAMSGRVAFSEDDIQELTARFPGEPVVLLRPDTVPEDIDLVQAVDGLLTARGGFTSHASVTAKRMGKCCVVNLREMTVIEAEKFARIGFSSLRTGDLISIDGHSGGVFSGKYEIRESTPSFRFS